MKRVSVCVAAMSLAWMVSVSSAQYDGYADADSADIADDALAGVDAADVADVTEAVAERSSMEWGRGPVRRAVFARLELVDGYRASARITAGARGIAVGARHAGGETAQWIDAKSERWLERITIGGLRVQCGEGLVLGATRSRFARTRVGSSPGVSVGPSLSLYSPLRGVGVTVRRGTQRVTAAAWRFGDRPACRWLSVQRGSKVGTMAVSAGVLADAEGGGDLTAVSLAGVGGGDRRRVAGEIALLGDAVMALVRTTVAAAGLWTAEIFGGAATDASGGVARIADDAARERGAALYRRGVWAGWKTTIAVFTATRRGNDGERLRRRVDCRGAYTSPSGLRYHVSARYDHDAEAEVAWGPLAQSVDKRRFGRGRIRGRVDIPAGSALSFRYLTEAHLKTTSPPGVLSGLAVRWDASHINLYGAVTNFALAGNGGYVVRPGIAGYETVSAVGRRGSDVAARATIRLGNGPHVSVYAGVPWQRTPRYLVAFRWVL